MVLGQSAATAAMQAIQVDVPVQAIDYNALRERLLAVGQVLTWTGPTRTSATAIDPRTLLSACWPALVCLESNRGSRGRR